MSILRSSPLRRRLIPTTSNCDSDAFSPDGRLLAGVAGSSATPHDANHEVPVWDLETGRLRHTLTGHEDEVGAVAFSPDGRRLVTGADDGTVRVWGVATGTLEATLEPGSDAPEPAPDLPHHWFPEVAFSPDGRRIVSGDGAGRLTVFDAQKLAASHTLHAHDFSFFGLAFAADGQLVTASSDGTAKVWKRRLRRGDCRLPHGRPPPQHCGVSAPTARGSPSAPRTAASA